MVAAGSPGVSPLSHRHPPAVNHSSHLHLAMGQLINHYLESLQFGLQLHFPQEQGPIDGLQPVGRGDAGPEALPAQPLGFVPLRQSKAVGSRFRGRGHGPKAHLEERHPPQIVP